ncbi:MAG: hypothetical protein ACI9X0_001605, partial [Kiritimatiellia bacterium]
MAQAARFMQDLADTLRAMVGLFLQGFGVSNSIRRWS